MISTISAPCDAPAESARTSNTGGGGWSNANSDDNAALSLPTPQVTTSTANDLRVTLTASNIDGVTFTPPVGFTENLDTSYATGRNIEIATKAQAATGPSGQPTVTASAPTGLSGYHLTIRPAPPSGSAATVAYTRDAADRIIERNLNGVSINRYAYTGAADNPSVVLNPSGTVVERSVSLPGGVLLTTRGSNASDVWSYPNAHGDITATCNGNGVKQGNTRAYDPFGNPLGTTSLPDNSAGNIDYTWHGTQTRPLEHEPNLTPTIEMGARQYSPQLGRFIETDPIEGGTPNDYTYPTDPINSSDLNGMFGWSTITGAVSGTWHSVNKFAKRHSKGLRKIGRVAAFVAGGAGAILCGASVVCGLAIGAGAAAAGYLAANAGTRRFSWGGLALTTGVGGAGGAIGAWGTRIARSGAAALEEVAASRAAVAGNGPVRRFLMLATTTPDKLVGTAMVWGGRGVQAASYGLSTACFSTNRC